MVVDGDGESTDGTVDGFVIHVAVRFKRHPNLFHVVSHPPTYPLPSAQSSSLVHHPPSIHPFAEVLTLTNLHSSSSACQSTFKFAEVLTSTNSASPHRRNIVALNDSPTCRTR